MIFKKQFRILGYYHFPNQYMKPEEIRIHEAKELAPLLGNSLQSIYNNPETDIVIKEVISTPTVFILKDKDNQLYGYFTKDKTVRLTNVKYDKTSVEPIPLKYKAWFTPGQEIELIKEQSIKDKFPQIENVNLDLKKEDLFELWGVDDCEIIGYYHKDPKSEGFLIDDLRKTNFERIPPYLSNNKSIELWLKYPQKGIALDYYYRFIWKLSHKDKNNPYEIYLDNRFSPQTITPKWFIDKLFEDRHNDKSKNFGSAANFLDTLSKQLSARESTFVYELLQNANDYPVEGHKVDVEFLHNGQLPFILTLWR